MKFSFLEVVQEAILHVVSVLPVDFVTADDIPGRGHDVMIGRWLQDAPGSASGSTVGVRSQYPARSGWMQASYVVRW
ncbi:MAG: hypothetical protein RMJ43_02970 [Chloroherpetonaceae bacterium]|nr:hypothetical protein [Chthonomonadaceae bacterium]MDW8206771.1 hypothetical protein [Chloroherpetonaceae bacterium]